MSTLSTHVLDTAKGTPAEGMPITLERSTGKDEWQQLSQSVTNADGRVTDLCPDGKINAGVFRLTFDTKAYFEKNNTKGFYPCASIVFQVEEGQAHYHVPLLISGWGYSTYRGS
jgi:5-hydroxyisourate hydrolase